MTLKPQKVTHTPFPFAEITKVTNAICEDGVQRTAVAISSADTFFSIPARVQAYGKTISGYLTRETLQGFSTETPGDPAVWKFIAYSYGKNGHLLKPQKDG